MSIPFLLPIADLPYSTRTNTSTTSGPDRRPRGAARGRRRRARVGAPRRGPALPGGLGVGRRLACALDEHTIRLRAQVVVHAGGAAMVELDDDEVTRRDRGVSRWPRRRAGQPWGAASGTSWPVSPSTIGLRLRPGLRVVVRVRVHLHRVRHLRRASSSSTRAPSRASRRTSTRPCTGPSAARTCPTRRCRAAGTGRGCPGRGVAVVQVLQADSPIAVITPTAWVCGPMPSAWAASITYAAFTRRSWQ